MAKTTRKYFRIYAIIMIATVTMVTHVQHNSFVPKLLTMQLTYYLYPYIYCPGHKQNYFTKHTYNLLQESHTN